MCVLINLMNEDNGDKLEVAWGGGVFFLCYNLYNCLNGVTLTHMN